MCTVSKYNKLDRHTVTAVLRAPFQKAQTTRLVTIPDLDNKGPRRWFANLATLDPQLKATTVVTGCCHVNVAFQHNGK